MILISCWNVSIYRDWNEKFGTKMSVFVRRWNVRIDWSPLNPPEKIATISFPRVSRLSASWVSNGGSPPKPLAMGLWKAVIGPPLCQSKFWIRFQWYYFFYSMNIFFFCLMALRTPRSRINIKAMNFGASIRLVELSFCENNVFWHRHFSVRLVEHPFSAKNFLQRKYLLMYFGKDSKFILFIVYIQVSFNSLGLLISSSNEFEYGRKDGPPRAYPSRHITPLR